MCFQICHNLFTALLVSSLLVFYYCCPGVIGQGHGFLSEKKLDYGFSVRANACNPKINPILAEIKIISTIYGLSKIQMDR